MDILSQLRAGVITGSAAESQALAEQLAAVLPAGSVLALHGDLGVGKTTFVQGLARGLGIGGTVTSPTFNVFTLHRSDCGSGTGGGGGGRMLAHLDAYRLEGAGQLEDLMLEDFLVMPWWLAVEWPEKIADWLPPQTWHFDLGIVDGGRHSIRLR
ncbi:tRNA (adenosine(37)-N6)-threonylcarbamoyltransferase complex ATPase subunit type 1 TsaE [Geminisphaera colitermitum]|uniref:tRNA (adenosine(37)-N6)-threonylcarbamoyltransferase complex ATPase subunit type 1 TsaE n=1 Tax=Geminisphaera colitermitum TaxID=1148786 RepID=UPI0001964FDB|nr:tRNA (adenosine(37)-N6)-threonylcarbamoyltransferase complex ATPase subunit type 1 TsaE [Geminisphaera colitermitum]